MVVEILLSGILFASADTDCSILDTLLPNPIAAGEISVQDDGETVIVSGLGLAVFLSANPPVYEATPNPEDLHIVYSAAEAEALLAAADAGEPPNREESIELAQHAISTELPAVERSLGTLEADLVGDFVESAAARELWACSGRHRQIYASFDDYLLAVSLLPNGTAYERYSVSRPGYSTDGQSALVWMHSETGRSVLDLPGLPRPLHARVSSARLYVLLEKGVDGSWSVVGEHATLFAN